MKALIPFRIELENKEKRRIKTLKVYLEIDSLCISDDARKIDEMINMKAHYFLSEFFGKYYLNTYRLVNMTIDAEIEDFR